MATRRRKRTYKRTTTTRRKPTRRRRMGSVGAMKKIDMQSLAGLSTGAITSSTIDAFIDKFFPNFDNKIKAAVKIAFGVALPQFVKARGYDKFIKGVSDGYIVTGVSDFASDTVLPTIMSGVAGSLPIVTGKETSVPVITGKGYENKIPTITGCQLEELENNY